MAPEGAQATSARSVDEGAAERMPVATTAPDDPFRNQRHGFAMPAALRCSPAQLTRPAPEHRKRALSQTRAAQAGDRPTLPASSQLQQLPHIVNHHPLPTKAPGLPRAGAALQDPSGPAQPLSHCLALARSKSLWAAQWPLDAPATTVRRTQARPFLAASAISSPAASLRSGKECAR